MTHPTEMDNPIPPHEYAPYEGAHDPAPNPDHWSDWVIVTLAIASTVLAVLGYI